MTTREEMDHFCIQKLTDEGIIFCLEGKKSLATEKLVECLSEKYCCHQLHFGYIKFCKQCLKN